MSKHLLQSFILLSMLLMFVLLNAENTTSESEEIPRKIVTVEIVDNEIIATFNIPANMHQTKQEDFFYLEVDDVEGITFEDTVYPEGEKDEDGYINYHGTVKLTKKFTVNKTVPKGTKIKAYAGYQLCFDSYCEPPEEVEFELEIK